MKTKYILLLALQFASALATISYHGWQVFRIHPKTPENIAFLENEVQKLTLDVWTKFRKADVLTIDIMVSNKHLFKFTSDLEAENIPYSIMILDVQKIIDDQKKVFIESRALNHTTYHNLDEIYAILNTLESDFPDIVRSLDAGVTHEGRPLRVVEVSSSPSKPAVWIDCGIHAREWISPAFCLWVLDQLTSGYGNDPTVTTLLSRFDFYILPVVNPDGYAYTWEVDRMWRYNRSPNNGSDCIGVDLNRNFDSNFGGVGSVNDPCSFSGVYHGPYAFSEAETQAIRDSLMALNGRLAVYFAIHSYGQLWMTPFGYKLDLPPNYDVQYTVAEIGVQALTAVHGTLYDYGNHFIVIYPASGISIDWVYENTNTSNTFLIEVRDNGEYGFLLPQEQIVPVGEETWAGITAALLSV